MHTHTHTYTQESDSHKLKKVDDKLGSSFSSLYLALFILSGSLQPGPEQTFPELVITWIIGSSEWNTHAGSGRMFNRWEEEAIVCRFCR